MVESQSQNQSGQLQIGSEDCNSCSGSHSFSQASSAQSSLDQMTKIQKKQLNKVGKIISKGHNASIRMKRDSNKSLKRKFSREFKDNTYKKQNTTERSQMFQIFRRRRTLYKNRMSVNSSENQELIKQYKLKKQRERDSIFKGLKLHKNNGKIQYEESDTDSEEIDQIQYLKMLKQISSEQIQQSIQLKEQKPHWSILSYYSVNRYRFDMITCIFVLYDCFMVPYKNTIGLQQEMQDQLYFLEYVITTIFIIDLLLCFRKGYISEKTGEHITCPKKIAIGYLKFYFWIDLLGCIPFDMFTEDKLLRFISLLKTLRLLRFKKLVHLMGLNQQSRFIILILQLILTMLIIIHWVTCLFHNIVLKNYKNQIEFIQGADKILGEDYTIVADGQRIPIFKFSYWIPQFELNDGHTNIYEEQPYVQYIKIFYYIVLLLTGNDICPQTNLEIFVCSIFLVVGSIMVAIIMAGFTSEMEKAVDQDTQFQKLFDFVYFSLQIHKLPSMHNFNILNYMNKVNESNEVDFEENDFFESVNPEMRYQIIKIVYYEEMRKFPIFENSQQSEIMFLAMLMKAKLNIPDEEIITQGDQAEKFYIIFTGKVTVLIQETQFENATAKVYNMIRAKNKFQRLLSRKKKVINIGKLKSLRKSKPIQQNQSNIDNQRKNEAKFLNIKATKAVNFNQVEKEIQEREKSIKQILAQQLKKKSRKHQDNDLLQKAGSKFQELIKSSFDVNVMNPFQQTDKGRMIDERQEWLQMQNKTPVYENRIINQDIDDEEKQLLTSIKHLSARKPIKRLGHGDIFGEIGLLTNFKRTASICTHQMCIFQTLKKDNLEDIKKHFPSLFDRIYDNMSNYYDEDMMQKKQFVHNIPYFRGLELSTIQRIVFLIKQHVYEQGDPIHLGSMPNKNIMILWEGTVQVRVERVNPETKQLKSFWFDTLEKGACFSVFNCFDNTKSLLNYYAASPTVKIDMISAEELLQLSQEIIAIDDRLKVIQLRKQNKQIDDLDYFTFPKRFLQLQQGLETQQSRMQKWIKYGIAKKVMIQEMLNYVRQYKAGMCKFPAAIDLLQVIRADRELYDQNEYYLIENNFIKLSSSFNIRQIYAKMKKNKDQRHFLKLNRQILEIDSAHEFGSMTSINTVMSSDDSIKCLSFHTNDSIEDMQGRIKHDCQLDNKQTQMEDSLQETVKKSLFSKQSGSTSSVNKRFKKFEIECDIKKFKNSKVQIQNANHLLRQQITNSCLITDIYLRLIEQSIFDQRNFQLLRHVITKQRDETFQFRSHLQLAFKNVQVLFNTVQVNDFQSIVDLILNGNNLIFKNSKLLDVNYKDEVFDKLVNEKNKNNDDGAQAINRQLESLSISSKIASQAIERPNKPMKIPYQMKNIPKQLDKNNTQNNLTLDHKVRHEEGSFILNDNLSNEDQQQSQNSQTQLEQTNSIQQQTITNTFERKTVNPFNDQDDKINWVYSTQFLKYYQHINALSKENMLQIEKLKQINELLQSQKIMIDRVKNNITFIEDRQQKQPKHQ